MTSRLLIITAHPDDESLGPAGTLAYYAARGVDIHLVVVTDGAASEVTIPSIKALPAFEQRLALAEIRQQETRSAASTIGIAQVDFLNYPDGQLCNLLYHDIATQIIAKIEQFKPQVVLTIEPKGISGHLDHIAISMITTYAFKKTSLSHKLYYSCLPKDIVQQMPYQDYFVYFPEGYDRAAITTQIDYQNFKDTKIQAMLQHQSQINDINKVLQLMTILNLPSVDFFILHEARDCQIQFPETDLFAGIGRGG